MSTVSNDLRFALRQLRKSPGFTLTAVLTLALGIGASSAIFCLIDGLWLHPMPVGRQGANPMLDPMFITSLPELIHSSTGDYQMMAELVSALGLIGLLLTIVGLYGFLAFRVTQRKREIGIRMALGASRGATALLVLRDTVKLPAIGLGFGLVFAILATRLERSVLFGVHPLDPVSLLAAFTLLTVAALGASWLPARRAASIEPMQALRSE